MESTNFVFNQVNEFRFQSSQRISFPIKSTETSRSRGTRGDFCRIRPSLSVIVLQSRFRIKRSKLYDCVCVPYDIHAPGGWPAGRYTFEPFEGLPCLRRRPRGAVAAGVR